MDLTCGSSRLYVHPPKCITTQSNAVYFEKLTVSYLVKKFPVCYGTENSISVVT